MDSPAKIPFNRPGFQGQELTYITQAIEQGHISGNGPFAKRCEGFFEERLGIPQAILAASCTDALEMSALLLDIEPGDEIIVPSFTFVSTLNAFVLFGAKPVYVDIRPDTLNMDETQLEDLITPKTKAIIPVHYAGVACEMDVIMDIAQRHDVAVVEDNAHGFLGKFKGQYLGTFGALATQSFHETKNVTSGEGGALIVNDESLVERAEIIRDKGTNRSRFFRGQVDKYTWVDLGSSYSPSELVAAFLYAQLENVDRIQESRKAIWNRYHIGLKDWASANVVRLPIVPEHCDQAYHMFYMLLPTGAQRDAFIAHLREHAISAVFHYLPLHLSDMGQKFGGAAYSCPVTIDVSERLVRLPFYNELSPEDQSRVIETIQRFTF